MKHLELIFFSFIPLAFGQVYDWDDVTPLDDYVHWDDGYYQWTELTDLELRYDRQNVTVYQLNMTSQKWPRDYDLTERSLWWHYMGIAIPDQIDYPNHAGLWIGGDGNDDPPQNDSSLYSAGVAEMASDLKMVVAYVLQVPNDNMLFYNYPIENDPIGGDPLMAWTWRTVMDMPEPVDWSIVARAPMTKSAKRGLDAVQEFGALRGLQLDNFLTVGASKRGWTAWSLASTDRRIKLMTPIVFNLLDMPEVLFRHYEALDEAWSFAFDPYWGHPPNLTKSLYNVRNEGIFDMEDMYRYRPRLAGMDKLMILATGDEFFFPDNTHLWWNDIPAPMHMYLVQNTEHVLFPQYDNVYDTIVAHWKRHVDGIGLPDVTWTRGFTADGAFLEMQVNPPPDELTAWRGETINPTNPRRDFRLITYGTDPDFQPVIWRNDTADIIDLGGGRFRLEETNSFNEWVGFFFSGVWYTDDPSSRGGYRDIYLTTEVQITPDTFPGTRCNQDPDCYGYLV